MSVSSNSTTDYLNTTANEPDLDNFSLCYWLRKRSTPGSFAAHCTFTTASHWMQFSFDGNDTLVLAADGGNANLSTMTNNAWYFVAMRGTGSGSVTAYMSAVGSNVWDDSGTASTVMGTPTEFAILGNNTWSEGHDFDIANFILWDGTVLSADELLAMKHQFRPHRTDMDVWCPFIDTDTNNFTNYAQGWAWTEGGSVVQSDNPPIPWQETARRIFIPAGGGSPPATRRRINIT